MPHSVTHARQNLGLLELSVGFMRPSPTERNTSFLLRCVLHQPERVDAFVEVLVDEIVFVFNGFGGGWGEVHLLGANIIGEGRFAYVDLFLKNGAEDFKTIVVGVLKPPSNSALKDEPEKVGSYFVAWQGAGAYAEIKCIPLGCPGTSVDAFLKLC